MLVAIIVCLASAAASLWAAAAAMSDVGLLDAGDALYTMLAKTHMGHAGICGMIVLLALAAVHLPGRTLQTSRGYLPVMVVLLLIFALTRASISHAAEYGMFSFSVWVEWIHLLSVSMWTGVVVVSAWFLLPAVTHGRPKEPATVDLLATMSRTATIALAGTVATGAFNAYRGLGSVDNLLGNSYANVLLIKLVLVVMAIGLGGFNRFFAMPAATAPDTEELTWTSGMRRIVAVLRVESLLLLGVLIAAAVLTGEPPPALS